MNPEEICVGDILFCDLSAVPEVKNGAFGLILVTDILKDPEMIIQGIRIGSTPKDCVKPSQIHLGIRFGLLKDSTAFLRQTVTILSPKLIVRKYGTVDDPEILRKLQKGKRQKIKKARSGMVLCLCDRCRKDFMQNPNNIIRRIDPLTSVRTECDYCQAGRGYDYFIYKRKKKI